MAMSTSGSSRSGTANLSALPAVEASAGGGGSFEKVQRGGYHPGRVDEYVHWAESEIARLGRELEEAARRAVPGIERYVESPQGRRAIAEIIQLAADEITGNQVAAEAQIAQMLAGAEEQAGIIVSDARKQATEIHSSATAQATSLLNSARADAKQVRDAATAEATAVHEAAGQRMAQLAKIHEDGLTRLAKVQEVTSQVLAAETERGSLADEVNRVLTQPGVPQVHR